MTTPCHYLSTAYHPQSTVAFTSKQYNRFPRSFAPLVRTAPLVVTEALTATSAYWKPRQCSSIRHSGVPGPRAWRIAAIVASY